MKSISVTEARKNFFKLLQNVNKKHEFIHLHYSKGNAVIMSEEDYESLIETLDLLSEPKFKKSLRLAKKQAELGDLYSLKDVFK